MHSEQCEVSWRVSFRLLGGLGQLFEQIGHFLLLTANGLQIVLFLLGEFLDIGMLLGKFLGALVDINLQGLEEFQLGQRRNAVACSSPTSSIASATTPAAAIPPALAGGDAGFGLESFEQLFQAVQ